MDSFDKVLMPAEKLGCYHCGECCSRYQVLLDKGEEAKLSRYLGIPLDEFIDKYSDPRWPGTGRYLVKHIAGKCVFLKENGKQFLCSIHDIKPRVCREWRPELSRIECRTGLEKLWNLTVEPEGGAILGNVHDVEVFQNFFGSLS